MGGRKGQPQPCGTRRHGGRADGHRQEAALFKRALGCQRGLGRPDHDRHDGARRCRQPRAGRKTGGQTERALGTLRLGLQNGKGRKRRPRGCRRQPRGIDESPAAIADEFGHRSGTGEKTAIAAKRLGKRAHLDIGLHTRRRQAAAPGRQHAAAMGVVDIKEGIMAAGEAMQGIKRRPIPVHREDPFGHDPGMTMAGTVGRQFCFEIATIIMLEGKHTGP